MIMVNCWVCSRSMLSYKGQYCLMVYNDNDKLLGLLEVNVVLKRSIVSYSNNGKLLGLLEVEVVLK